MLNDTQKDTLQKIHDVIADDDWEFDISDTFKCICGAYERVTAKLGEDNCFLDLLGVDIYNALTQPQGWSKFSRHHILRTKKQALATIQHLIKTGVVDWEIG